MAVSIAALVAVIAIIFTYSAAMNIFEERMSSVTERQMTNSLISEIEGKIRQEYCGEIDEQSLRDAMSEGLINGLDNENCDYLTSEEWELCSDRIAGFDFGYGLDVSRASDGNILVNRVTSGSPASSAGVRSGDIITYVNGVTVLSTGYDKAVATMSGSNSVTLKVKRDGSDYSYSVTKQRFTIVSVEYSIVEAAVGKIKIYSFNETTPDQFNAAYSALKAKGVESIIIDLRDNSGGSYEYACSVLDTILPQGNLMFMTDGTGLTKVMYVSDNRAISMPISILVNEQTTGAAEMFASAVYDYGKCSLVGTATKGVAYVQEYFELSDGSAVELSVGTWSTDRGRAVSEGRVVPEFEVKMTSYQYENRYILSNSEDPQIQTALQLLYSAMEENAANEAAALDAYTSSSTDVQ